ncbi:MAG: hypothetical protein WA937_08230 [Flavobacteriales bacterium]
MVAGPLVVLAAIVIEAFPYLAITELSGAKVMVVEGWMDPAPMQEAAELILDSNYTRVYTTGTVRRFAHYLSPDEGITVQLHIPFQGEVRINVSGTAGAGFLLIAGTDTLMDQAVTPQPQLYNGHVPNAVDRIRLVAWHLPLETGTPEIYVASLTLNGMNINLLQRRSWFTFPDAVAQPGWPTYAQSARSELMKLGVPGDRITAVPAYGKPRSRTWGNAHAFGIQAREDGITAFDVATVGVHARRSRDLFRTACGPEVRVGVIALTDPYCTQANWWRSFRGWITMLKEVVGASEAQAVELTR